MKCVECVRALVGSVLAVLVLGSGSCEVGVRYCSDDCDPCTQVCACDDPCRSALAVGAAGAYRMRAFVLTEERHPGGAWTRTYSGFVGLSLDRAFGPGEHDEAAIELYARNLIARNPEFLGHGSGWSLVGLERAGGGCVITFVDSADGSLELLLDRKGQLVAVARHGAS